MSSTHKADCSLASIDVKNILAGDLVIEVTYDNKTETLRLGSFDERCTCRKYQCKHSYAAEQWIIENIKLLMESYILNEKDVDNSHFLSPGIVDILRQYDKKISFKNINKAKEIVKDKISSIQSVEYIFKLIHFFIKENDGYFSEPLYLSKYLSLFYALFNDEFCYNVIVQSNILKDYSC